jgi:thymidine phosphorylase
VSASAGVLLHKKPGDAVRAGDVLMELRADSPERIPPAREVAAGAVVIADSAPAPVPLILERLV